ncbi:9318_t:CDS:2 [Funneliformis caledonium]|uniref:9318_t:CDS:1 n=2 Tax=Funneliformis TaxID=1117308 RepID=A0A9N9BZR9_9GLOM|nr:9318_t:CDS:2 [Funneliformis caledonium]CAG8606050.1 2281_t:CDS:2 [Funneliformis mosseae]
MENLSSHKAESILTTNSLELDDDSLNSFYIGMKSDPPLNQNLIIELEKQAQGISNELETMLRNLQSQMFEASVLTTASFEVYRQTVENHCMVINDATKKSNELIELCVRIDKEFSHVQTLASQIKSIKHQVDALHSALGR